MRLRKDIKTRVELLRELWSAPVCLYSGMPVAPGGERGQSGDGAEMLARH